MSFNYGEVWGMNLVSQPEERSCSTVWWYSSGYFCITCQMAAGWTGCCWGPTPLSLSILWVLCRYRTSLISLMLSRWCSNQRWDPSAGQRQGCVGLIKEVYCCRCPTVFGMDDRSGMRCAWPRTGGLCSVWLKPPSHWYLSVTAVISQRFLCFPLPCISSAPLSVSPCLCLCGVDSLSHSPSSWLKSDLTNWLHV